MYILVKVKLKPIRKLFYNDTSNYGIYSCETSEKDKVKLNDWGNFSIKGVMPSLIIGNEYIATLQEKEDKKYGVTYEVQYIYEEIPSDIEKQKVYLETILSKSQVDAIYKVYPNQDIIKLIQNDEFDVSKVKGIGLKTLAKIKEKIEDNVEFREALEFLIPHGIDSKLIRKLVKHYKSPSLLVFKVKQSPYNLLAVKGIGFKKADAIAMKMNFPKDHPDRIKYAIEYIIEEEEKLGHTYTTVVNLIKKVSELIEVEQDEIIKHVKESDAVGIYGDKVALKSTYNAELYIAKRLKELLANSTELKFNVEKFIEEQEVKRNIKLTEQQKSFFYNIMKHRVNLLVGYAGCVDKDTEFFNGEEWKKISEYKEGDLVLQYNEDGTAELVKPIAYHKLPETKMTLIKTDLGSINQCLSDDHTVVYRTSKGHIAKLPFHEVARRHRETPKGFYGKFISFFRYDGEGIDLSDEEIRVMVMVIADGYFMNHTNLCRVRVKKDRKKERIRFLLENAQIPYTERNCVDNYIEFKFVAPLRLKHFDSSWYQCSQHQLQVICDEVLHWDGSIDKKGRRRFSSNVKESAEFIQFTFSATGHRATLTERDRTGQTYKDSNYTRKSKEYTVQIAKNKWVSLFARTEDKKTPLIEIVPEDGYKYCFTVPSGMWIMRREGRICVTGNCGKSQVTALLIDLLDKFGYTYKILAPTGKAAKVISTYTGRKAYTIHRAIGIREDKEEVVPIKEDFIIVDEASMLDIKLCAKLLSRLSSPNVRVLFVGDSFQIPSVGAGCFLHDCMESGILPMTKLDIVFRQKDGGILDVATNIRLKKKFVENDFLGIKKIGNDCILACVPQEKMEGGYKYFYKELLKEHSPEQIMVLSPTKKGKLGTETINKYVQEQVNPSDGKKKEIAIGKDKEVIFREGDYVINTKNTYGIFNIDEMKTDIVNGDTGTIVKLDDFNKEVIVDFEFDIVPIPFSDLGQLQHSWSITKHKSQGSGVDAVIVIADKSHKFQLNANLLYTACTRAKKMLVILTQAETLNYAMRKIANLQRNTFLKDMLKNNLK